MDPQLLKQMQRFQKRALAQPTVSTKANNQKREAEATKKSSHKAKKHKSDREGSGAKHSSFNYKTAQASMAANFGILARIVDHMKKRHLDQSAWSLDLEEILEEIQMFDLSVKTKEWLEQVLPKNPKISVDGDRKYIYQPPYKIKGKNSLLRLLRTHDQDGKGGILMSDVADSIPNAEKTVEALAEQAYVIPTSVNKRKDKVVFFNDTSASVPIEDEFKSLYRTIPVEHLDDHKIEEYLTKHGITSTGDGSSRNRFNPAQGPKRKPAKKRNVIVHNEHLNNVLQDFSV